MWRGCTKGRSKTIYVSGQAEPVKPTQSNGRTYNMCNTPSSEHFPGHIASRSLATVRIQGRVPEIYYCISLTYPPPNISRAGQGMSGSLNLMNDAKTTGTGWAPLCIGLRDRTRRIPWRPRRLETKVGPFEPNVNNWSSWPLDPD